MRFAFALTTCKDVRGVWGAASLVRGKVQPMSIYGGPFESKTQK